MKVLITGGAGYLGSVLTRRLLDGFNQVCVYDTLVYGSAPLDGLRGLPGFELVEADVRESTALHKAVQGMDAVVHLAAIVGDPACAQHPQLAREVNRDGSFGLIDAARDAGVPRFIFASTCSNYGKMADTSQFADESHELRPLSLYAETKVEVERKLLGAAAEPICATILRFATLYGLSSRMRFDLTVNEFVMRVLSEGKLTVYGEQFWRPYVHVADAARAIEGVLKAPETLVAGQVFNVGSTGENYRKLDLVELLRARIAPAEIAFVQQASDPRDYRVSFERIRERLQFSISRTVPDGMDEIAAAIRGGSFANAHSYRTANAGAPQ